jgi:hypothetical protein
MEEKEKEPSVAMPIQVFELTMDNAEDQDELNRRLRKPGEPALGAPAKVGGATISPAPSVQGESAGKQ